MAQPTLNHLRLSDNGTNTTLVRDDLKPVVPYNIALAAQMSNPKNLGTKLVSCQAAIDAAVDRTYLTGLALDTHFDAIRIGFYNASETAYTGLKSLVAVGPDATNKSGKGLTFVPLTFNNAATANLPAGNATNPPITFSDWIPLASVDRTDGGRNLPLLYVKTYHPTGGGQHTVCAAGGDSVDTLTNSPDGRIVWTQSVAGDFTGAGTEVVSAGRMITTVGVVQYMSRRKVINIAAFGDSITLGSTSSKSFQSWAYRVAAMISDQYGIPVSYSSHGWKGQTTSQILARAQYNIPLVKPDIVLFPSWSPNDPAETQATPAMILTMRSNLSLLAKVCQDNGACPVTWTGIPKAKTASASFYTVDADACRTGLNKSVLNDYSTCMPVMDLSSAMGNGAVPECIKSKALGYPADLSTDWLHPNDAGYNAMAGAALPTILTIAQSY